MDETDISKKRLYDVLNQNDYYTKLQQKDQEFINFLFDNFDLLINFIFEDQKVDYRIGCKCLAFLKIQDAEIHNRLLQETKIIDFLTDYPSKFRLIDHNSRYQYKILLERFILPSPSKFDTKVGNLQLFENLLSVIDYNTSFEIIKNVISQEDQKVIFYLLNIHFIDLVSQYLIGNDILNFNSQKILIQLIECGCENFVAESLTKDALISSFVFEALKIPHFPKNFKFIEKIYKYSVNYSMNSNWKTIEIIISSRIDEFRKIVKNEDNWSGTSNVSLSIICDILSSHDMLTEKDFILFNFLMDKFFLMPHCSILHLSVLKYFKVIHSLGKLNLALLDETQIIPKIIDCYKNRDQLSDCNYFGAIREMSYLITPIVDKENYEEWNSFVVKKNKEISKIIGIKNSQLQFQKKSILSSYYKLIIFLLILIVFVISLFIKL